MIMQRQPDGTYAQIGFIKSNIVITTLYGDGTAENSDTCDLSTGIITRRWGVKVFDGTESFFKNSPASSNYLYYVGKSSSFSSGDVQCTHLSNSDEEPIDNIGINNTNQYNVTYLNFGKDVMNAQPSGNTVDGLKEFLASEYAKGTPVTVYYPLATPTTETITIPTGLTGTVIGNATQDGTPTPEAPIEVVGKSIYEDIDRIVDRNGDVYFTKGFTRQITGTPPLSLDAIGKPLINYKIYGNTVQDGTPSPENPVEVQGVGDLVRISFDTPLYGDGTAENSDTCDLSTGIITRRWGVKVFDGTEKYFAKNDSNESSYLYYCRPTNIKAKNGNIKCTHLSELSYIPLNNIGISNNSNTTMNAIYFNFGADVMNAQPSGNTAIGLMQYITSEYAKGTPVTVYYPLATPTTENIVLPSGLTGTVIGNMTQNGTPIPEAPVEVVGINSYDYGYEIPVVCRGKNYLDVSSIDEKILSNVKFTVSNGIVKLNGICTVSTNLEFNIGILKGRYTLSSNANRIPITNVQNCIDLYRASPYMQYAIQNNNAINGYVNFEIAEDTTMKFRIRLEKDVDYTGFEIRPQIELGGTATEYEPYHEPVTTSIFLDEPLYKDDYITKDKSGGKLHRAWGVKVFDGTEIFNNQAGEYDTESKSLFDYHHFNDAASGNNMLCSHFKKINNAQNINAQTGTFSQNVREAYKHFVYFNISNETLGVTLSDSETTKVSAFKAFLTSEYTKGTPVTVYYPLATPTEESIELPEIPTFDGTTIIETNTEIQPSDMEITYKSKKSQ